MGVGLGVCSQLGGNPPFLGTTVVVQREDHAGSAGVVYERGRHDVVASGSVWAAWLLYFAATVSVFVDHLALNWRLAAGVSDEERRIRRVSGEWEFPTGGLLAGRYLAAVGHWT